MHLLQEKELKKEESNPTNSMAKIKKKKQWNIVIAAVF